MNNGYLDTGPARSGADESDLRDAGAGPSASLVDPAAETGRQHVESSVEELWIPAEDQWTIHDEPSPETSASEVDAASEGPEPTSGTPDDEAVRTPNPFPAPAGALESSPPAELQELPSRDTEAHAQDEEQLRTSQAELARYEVPAEPTAAMAPRPEEAAPAPEMGTPEARRLRPRRALGAVVLVAVIASAVAFVVTRSGDALPAGAAFRVDGKVVTQDALDRRVHVLGALYGVTPPTDPKKLDAFRRDTAKALVLSIVMDDAARSHGVVIADKVVSDVLDRVISERYPQGGRGEFVKALAVQGIGEQDVLDELRRQLAVRQLYDQVTSGITVSEAAARADFLAHPEKYKPPQQRHLSELVVADEATARAILAQLKAGSSFAALARSRSLDASTRSSGGDLGSVTAAELDPAFASAAFTAAKGQPFGPVQTSLGWYLGVVQDIVQPPAPTFDEVKDQVRQQLANLAQVKAWRAFLQERLKRGHARYASAYRPASPDALPAFGLGTGVAQATPTP